MAQLPYNICGQNDRETMRKILFTLIALFLTCLGGGFSRAHAAFSLAVRPYEGGYDLRFGAVKSSAIVVKEVTVQIVSDLGKQYQVVFFVLDPLVNAAGQTIGPESIFVSAVRGSNSQGSLFLQPETPVSTARTIVYTSAASGLSDSFRLNFGLRGQSAPGNYRGRMAFMLEPINAAVAPVTAVVNVFADVTADARIQVTPQRSASLVSLGADTVPPYTDSVSIGITGGLGTSYRILQALVKPLESSDGARLNEGTLTFAIDGNKNGNASVAAEIVSQRSMVLYSSDPRGEADSFLVHYTLKNPEKAAAGRYRGRMNFLLESSSPGQRLLQSLDLQVDVPRVFDLVATPQSGGIIEFHSSGKPGKPEVSRVLVQVRSNINRQYQVSQRLSGPLLNRQGLAIPENNFNIRQEGAAVKGSLRFLKASPVRAGDTTLFVSDRQGSPESFTVIYELLPGAQVTAGDYSASIIYSISEL